MHTMLNKILAGVILPLGALLLASGANAAGPGRAATSELVFRTNYVESVKLDGENNSYLETDDDIGFGIGFMYNMDRNWAFGGSFDWFDTDYEARAIADLDTDRDFTYRNSLESLSINFDANYYFLDGNITPYVTGSLGWTNLDSNVASGPGYEYCWWSYYGYYCTVTVPTVSESGFNYKLGGGLMWEVSRYFVVRGSVSYSEVDIDVAGENPYSTIWRLELVSRI